MTMASRSTGPLQRLSLQRALGLGFLCVTVFAGYARAQAVPAVPEPVDKVDQVDKPEAAPKAEVTAQAEPPAKTEPPPKAQPPAKSKAQKAGKGAAKSRGAKKRTKRAPMTMDPGAKWACNNTTVTLKPVWRGEEKLTFNFNIRNEGTADLRIKARGG